MNRYKTYSEQPVIITENNIAVQSLMMAGNINENYSALSESMDTRQQAICMLKETNFDDELARKHGFEDFRSFLNETSLMQRDDFWREYHNRVDEIVDQLREVK